MADDGLDTVLAALDTDATPPAASDPVVVTVGCPLADCRHDPSWLAETGAAHASVPSLGTRTWERRDGRRELQESLGQLVADRGVAAAVVVGHTDCDVVADAYDRYCGPERSSPAGVRAALAPLERVVADAVDGDAIDTAGPRRRVRHRLVEYNVVRNVAFLRDRLPATTVAGVVVDQAGVYGSFPGKEYLVALDDAIEPAALRERMPEDAHLSVGRLLSAAAVQGIDETSD